MYVTLETTPYASNLNSIRRAWLNSIRIWSIFIVCWQDETCMEGCSEKLSPGNTVKLGRLSKANAVLDIDDNCSEEYILFIDVMPIPLDSTGTL